MVITDDLLRQYPHCFIGKWNYDYFFIFHESEFPKILENNPQVITFIKENAEITKNAYYVVQVSKY